MLHTAALALWFFIPAGFANVAPVLVAAVPGLKRWNAPIDGNRQFRGLPILGPHKTWRGLAAGIILATAVFYVQQVVFTQFGWVRWVADPVPYANLSVFVMGPLFALGALGGDAAESFFKRRRGLKSGEAWVGFDQLDYVLGAIVCTLPVVRLSVAVYLAAVVVWFTVHLISSYIGWVIGFKEKPI